MLDRAMDGLRKAVILQIIWMFLVFVRCGYENLPRCQELMKEMHQAIPDTYFGAAPHGKQTQLGKTIAEDGIDYSKLISCIY